MRCIPLALAAAGWALGLAADVLFGKRGEEYVSPFASPLRAER